MTTKGHVKTNLDPYSDYMIDKFVNSAPGKPVNGTNGELVGSIISAERVKGTKDVILYYEGVGDDDGTN